MLVLIHRKKIYKDVTNGEVCVIGDHGKDIVVNCLSKQGAKDKKILVIIENRMYWHDVKHCVENTIENRAKQHSIV